MLMAEDSLIRTAARVFLAIPLHEIFPEIGGILRPLCCQVPGVRWADPRRVHLTLHFFGFISAKEIELIHPSFKKIMSFFSPFKLCLGGIGGFPDLERPHIVWLGIEEHAGRLLSLQKAIQGEVRALGFETEARPFQPHATIGRVKRKNQNLGPLLKNLKIQLPHPERTVDHVALYQSRFLPDGVRYEILKIYPLSKKA